MKLNAGRPDGPWTFPPFFRLLLAAALLPLLSLVNGCAIAPRGDGGGGRPTVRLFSPMNRDGVAILSPSEAESLALKMELRSQGLSSWRDLDFAVSQSLAFASSKASDATALDRQGLRVSYGQLAESLRHLKLILPRLDAYPGLLAKDFTWYRIGPDFGFTGYYEPTLQASRTRSAKYAHALYRKPPDLKKGKAYYSRNAIDRKGALAGRGLELAWVSSDIDAFFLHIQGSGRLRFENGSVSHVLYADKNNHAYNALGRIMKERGLLAPDNVNMQSIRRYLEEHPGEKAELFDQNPSYVFFRESDKGPYGAMGRPLTPWVSTAVDRKVLPHGSLTFIIVPLPDRDGNMLRPFYGLTLPQDVGGAIKNNRMDFFCGAGPEAEHTAGFLNAQGAVYVLVKK